MGNFREKYRNFVKKSKKSGEITIFFQKYADLENISDLKTLLGS
jgi:hypothetical protein